MSDVYAKRQTEKELRAKYHEEAKDVNLAPDIELCGYKLTIPDRANVKVMDDGAFVEAIIWVPKEKS